MKHQYIDRETGLPITENLVHDRVIAAIYSGIRENARFLFDLLVSPRASALVGFLNYDFRFKKPPLDPDRFFRTHGIDLREIEGRLEDLTSLRKVFERRIRFREVRPMPETPGSVVSPADSKMLAGSFSREKSLWVKEKFFNFMELLGGDKPEWLKAFDKGDWAVFRLTPEKYHYNHVPAAGRVIDFYGIDGCFHSCNPGAVVREVTPYSKNRRVVTLIDTDVDGGEGIGLVAMVEVGALMIGQIVQCYSGRGYEDPVGVSPGLFLKKGQPKSLFRPGSSTTILIFQRDRIKFSRDILGNLHRKDVQSRFTSGFGRPLVETDVRVRSIIGQRLKNNGDNGEV
ncbi:phosphatidylserine decarboxylase [Desulfospira joergensenii]|uniref:phosphatidylserine decarboxylase n=1 Tax=Desulfospira joergensenii TaxID=53329 RepID=UPI0003B76714|nr:phosphatidylserine decarboxylase [Desulfospira joergensenii]